jgi:hypothetical protein
MLKFENEAEVPENGDAVTSINSVNFINPINFLLYFP